MIFPSVLGLLTPIVIGLLLGVAGGWASWSRALTCGFAWPSSWPTPAAPGTMPSTLSPAQRQGHAAQSRRRRRHRRRPLQDTSGPSLNILIKLMSMVSVVAAGLIVRYSLVGLGLF